MATPKAEPAPARRPSVLSLYDLQRVQQPAISKKAVTWAAFDSQLGNALSAAGKPIVLVSPTVISPSTKGAIAEFMAKHPGSSHIMYDAISQSGMVEAMQAATGTRAIPHFRMDKAMCIASINADFLGNWINPVLYMAQWAKNRKVTPENPNMSRVIMFEGALSTTGANADRRATIKPSQEGVCAAALYNAVAALAGKPALATPTFETAGNAIAATAKELWANKGKALVVAGSNDAAVQTVVMGINMMLGAFGTTIDAAPCMLRQGVDKDMIMLVNQMKAGQIGAIITWNVNPVYDWAAADFAEAMKAVPVTVAMSAFNNETTGVSTYVAADHHALEQWGDAEPVQGYFGLIQPAITPLFNSRQGEESLLRWAGNTTEYYTYLTNNWRKKATGEFEAFWRTTLNKGVIEPTGETASTMSESRINAAGAAANLPKPSTADELFVYEMTAMGNGMQANNPWLQEFPDPIARTTWGNFLSVPVKWAQEKGLKEGDVVRVKAQNYAVELPIQIQPGQMPGVFAMALGYGRKAAGKVGNGVGVNAAPLPNAWHKQYDLPPLPF